MYLRNSSEANITDPYSGGSDYGSILTLVAYCIRLVCVTGNLLVLVNFVNFRSLRQTRNYFSINMAVSDIQAGLFTITIMEGVFSGNYHQSFPGCEFILCYPKVIMLASVLSVLFSSLDRFVALQFPLRYPMIVTNGKFLMAIGFIWSVAILVGLLPLYGILNGSVKYCQGNYRGNIYFLTFVFLGIPIPIAATVTFLYLYISRIARNHDQNRRRFTLELTHACGSHGARALSKSARLVLVISLTMVICWMPLAVAYLMMGRINGEQLAIAFKIARFLSVLPHAINPWIYTLRNAEFRDASKKLFEQVCRKIRGYCLRKSSPVQPSSSSAVELCISGSLPRATDL